MKTMLFVVAMTIALNLNAQDHSQHTAAQTISDTAKGSPKRMAMADVGKSHVHIEYHSPAVRKRVIWGGLVPYGEVWVTGAHRATTISFSNDVRIAGKTIAKGKYAFFTIPGEKEWTLILNKKWDQHLADEYDQKDDVLRWAAKPVAAEQMERLTYTVVPAGQVEMRWEKIRISFDVAGGK